MIRVILDNINQKLKIEIFKNNFKRKLVIYFNGLVKEKFFIRNRRYMKISYFLDLSVEFRLYDNQLSSKDLDINYIKYLPFIYNSESEDEYKHSKMGVDIKNKPKLFMIEGIEEIHEMEQLNDDSK